MLQKFREIMKTKILQPPYVGVELGGGQAGTALAHPLR